MPTVMNQGLLFTVILCVCILFLPRKYVLVPVLIGAFYMTIGQFVLVGPFHFYNLRLIITASWIRIFVRREFDLGRFNGIDKTIICWGIVAIVAATVQDPSRAVAGLVNSLGWCYDALGTYFIIRIFIQDPDDVKQTIKWVTLLLVPLAVSMIIEKQTGRNLYSILGGVPEFSQIRDGHIRAQGPFLHPILAGTAAATSIPFIISLWWNPRWGKTFAVVGLVAVTAIVYSCSSSGPALTVIIAFAGMGAWFFRYHMRMVRWGLVVLIVSVQLLMNAPIWNLIGKIGNQTGGTGYHRAELITSAIAHLNEWWLVGTVYTRHWMPTGVTWSPNHTDITSQYIAQGVAGGLAQLFLFVLIIILCFKAIGIVLDSLNQDNREEQILVWGMGAALVAHAASFVSVSYFDQTIVFYYLLIAMISTSSTCFAEESETTEP
jgi:hypothetical protein